MYILYTYSTYSISCNENVAYSDNTQSREFLWPMNTQNKIQQNEMCNPISTLSNNTLEIQNNLHEDPKSTLSALRAKNIDRPIIACINIIFLENKFEILKSIIKDNVDILFVSETKLDNTFPLDQFAIEGYSAPIRRDRDCCGNGRGGGVMFFIREDLPYKELESPTLPKNIEGIFLEIKLRQHKWLIMGGYNPKKDTTSYFLNNIGKEIDKLLPSYENILVLGDFNSSMKEKVMQEFCEIYDLENLIKVPTCYKNPSNPSSIDVMLTNKKSSFQNSMTLETGLSDHHKMTITVLKRYFKKQDPITINYRDYKSFDGEKFRQDIKKEIKQLDTLCINDFSNIFMTVLNTHAPKKKKIIRGNSAPFMNKTLSKAFMQRSQMKNKYHKNPTETNKVLYKKQRNFCVNLLNRQKKNYYNNLDMKVFNDNKTFWKRIKPLFSEKSSSNRNITLIENDIVISDKREVAEKLNNYFVEAVEYLEIAEFQSDNDTIYSENVDEQIDNIIKKYKSHPSILKIKENVKLETKFKFSDITQEEIENEIKKLDSRKSIMEDDIPIKVLKGSFDLVSNYLSGIYNSVKKSNNFPPSLKLSDVTPIHKAKERTIKNNYRPVSIIPIISKIYEKIMYSSIFLYIEKFLSPYLFGYRKGHSTQDCLLVMVETWRKALDEKKYAGAILTDLSKAFDCLSHEILIAKLEAYGFDKSAMKFIYDYLKNRKQRTKVGGFYSSWRFLKYGVPQGSILGPLLFNIFINDIFFFLDKANICNYADDNSTYAVEDNAMNLLKTLQIETSTVLEWFRVNEMKPNSDKCHLILTSNNNVSYSSISYIYLDNELIESEQTVKLLGMKIDDKLNFNEHMTTLLKRGNQKLHALMRISHYLNKDKLRLIMNAFIKSQFNYCPLLWMNHNRQINHKINKLHERALRVVYKDDELTFQQLLDQDNAITTHDQNLKKLAIQMYRVKHNLCPLPVQELFKNYENPYNLRNGRCWEIPNVRTVNYGCETIRYRGPKTWDLLPAEIKDASSLQEFKSIIKKWKPQGCTCTLCKDYVFNLGYIN